MTDTTEFNHRHDELDRRGDSAALELADLLPHRSGARKDLENELLLIQLERAALIREQNER